MYNSFTISSYPYHLHNMIQKIIIPNAMVLLPCLAVRLFEGAPSRPLKLRQIDKHRLLSHSGGLANSTNTSTTPVDINMSVKSAAPRVLSASGNVVSSTNEDINPVLMEAKLREMITSLNQLISSNHQLEEALQECHDDDLLQALEENEGVIKRRSDDATMLATKLRKHGVNIISLKEIPQYHGSLVLKQIKEQRQGKKSENGGMYL